MELPRSQIYATTASVFPTKSLARKSRHSVRHPSRREAGLSQERQWLGWVIRFWK